jgi:hypothetical protein
LGRVRLFEPTAQWSKEDGTPTERANGFLRAISEFIGANTGTIPAGSIGLDGDSTHFLDGSGVPRTPDYRVGANPSQTVGLAAVNGSAVTFMRSDAAPAISLSIAPTWTALHTFSAGISSTSGVFSTTMTVTGGFGCNGKSAQTSATANAGISATAGAAYTATEQTMLNDLKALTNQIRSALIADGIMV